ncbi:MAG: hypothetical protein ACSLFR_11205 [Solirubrobacteraceae bacterium]
MDTLHRELDELVTELAPPIIDLEQLERLVTEDELRIFDDECHVHDGCRSILQQRLAG